MAASPLSLFEVMENTVNYCDDYTAYNYCTHIVINTSAIQKGKTHQYEWEVYDFVSSTQSAL